jgi:four helix bundle protein
LGKRNFDDAGKVLSKQFLRCGTSIGANCAEAKAAQSTKDFISKYEIALKEAHEFKFWCEVFIESELVPEVKFSWLLQEVNEIGRILNSSIVKLKQKNL